MRKVFRILTVVSLLMSSLAFNIVVGHGQSLAQERERVIELLMMGSTESFTFEEVEAYVKEEEAYIRETGNARPFSSYGINDNHSTVQTVILGEYLEKYLAVNTSESQLEELYPHAVDFTQLPARLNFYEAGGDDRVKFTVENEGNYLTIHPTNEREPLPSGIVNETDYYTDNAGWVENKTVLEDGLRHFYKKTGVQPHLYITTEINGSKNVSMTTLQEVTEGLYDDLFTDEGHILLVFYQGSPNKYMTYYVTGSQAKKVIDTEAGDILLDYIDHYYYDKSLNESQFFSQSFKDAADSIMGVATSPDNSVTSAASQPQFTGGAENKPTQALDVKTQDGSVRTVNVNTEMSAMSTAHRPDLRFYFFHNEAGGISMLVRELENAQPTLMEYTTLASSEASEPVVETVNTSNHAPYLQEYYYYRGADTHLKRDNHYRHITLQFPPDENGLYQFVREEWIAGERFDITYVYQFTDEGVYEQASFQTNNHEEVDYRYHEDVKSEQSSLILPAEVYPGLTYNSGYEDQIQYEVFAMHESFNFEGIDPTFKNVIQLSYQSEEDPNTYIHTFLAADIGVIGEASYNAQAGTYNLIYFLDYIRGSEDSSTPSSEYQEGDYPYAIKSEDLNGIISFYGPGTSNINLVVFQPESNMLDVYYDDQKDGGYALAYSTPIELSQVATKEIELTRNSSSSNHNDLQNKMKVNTQLSAVDPSVHKDAAYPFYLFYNEAGEISLAYWNEVLDIGGYSEMIQE